jgi:hypothetical protein
VNDAMTAIVSFVDWITRFTDAEYALLRHRMRGVQFMGPNIMRRWDVATAVNYVDLDDPIVPQFKQQLVAEGILQQARADVIFDSTGSSPTPPDSGGGGGAAGWTLLSSGTLNNQGSFDLVIPATGYSSFQLRLSGATIHNLPPDTDSDYMSLVVSYDGSSFISDAVNYDTYSLASMSVQRFNGADFSTRGSGLAGYERDWYALGYTVWDKIGYVTSPAAQFDLYMDFSPGDASHYFKAMIRLVSKGLFPNQGGKLGYEDALITLNPDAVSAPPMNRVALVRCGTNGFLYSAAAGSYFTSGKWFLLGL